MIEWDKKVRRISGPPIENRIDKEELIARLMEHGFKLIDCQGIGDEYYSIIMEKREWVMEIKKLQVEGMSCQHCVNAVKKAVGELKGTGKVEVDLPGKNVTVEFDPKMVTLVKIKEAIEDQGYDVVNGPAE